MIKVSPKMIQAGLKAYLKDRPNNEQQFEEMMIRIYRAMETKRLKEVAQERLVKQNENRAVH